ncbi:MAG: M10 family metallopeptidase C-terminal domain-containing protein, partial [Pseudomonadota bacterium]
GRGDDLISGGAGRDVLSGGRGDDVFLLSERERARDVIRDFTRGEDELQLHRSGDAFTFLGEQAFDGTENAIRAERKGRWVLVQVDDDGDGRADASARVTIAGGGGLGEDDFGYF